MASIPLSGDAAKALALAVIAASKEPVLLLDSELKVVAASDSFLSDFGLGLSGVNGHSLFSLGHGEWDRPALRSALSLAMTTGLEFPRLELDLACPGGLIKNLVLKSQCLSFGQQGQMRILVNVTDETEARACAKCKADLINDKAVLLGEIQHRVANSLQIIASLLLQDARSVSSEEGRIHLQEAHQRVMSVASLQRQLASSSSNAVIMRNYLEGICESIGASMTHDSERIHIRVSGDNGTASGEVSVSIGLIVTELVINALKYAFPNGRAGIVLVDYQSENDGWALSVIDNGVGMQNLRKADSTSGLGSAILNALAKQLAATVTVSDLHPGTGVSVVHPQAKGLLNVGLGKTVQSV